MSTAAEDGIHPLTGEDVLPSDYNVLSTIISRIRRRKGLPKYYKAAFQGVIIQLLLEVNRATRPDLSGFNSSRRVGDLLATLKVCLDYLSDGGDHVALEAHLRSKGFLRP